MARGLSSCGTWASLVRGMWDLPGPGLEPVSPALAGGFLTTAPPGKPKMHILNQALGDATPSAASPRTPWGSPCSVLLPAFAQLHALHGALLHPYSTHMTELRPTPSSLFTSDIASLEQTLRPPRPCEISPLCVFTVLVVIT